MVSDSRFHAALNAVGLPSPATTYIDATCHHLTQTGLLIRQVAQRSLADLLQVYGQQLIAYIQPSDAEPLTLEVGDIYLSCSATETTAAFRSRQAQLQIEQQVLAWLQAIFQHNQLWPVLAETVWTRLLDWSIQDLEPHIQHSLLATIHQERFSHEVWRSVICPDSQEHQTLAHTLIATLAEHVADTLLTALQQAQLSSAQLERILGIQTEGPWPVLSLVLDLGAIATSPISQGSLPPPTVRALEPPLIERRLTSLKDIHALPWSLLAHIHQQWGVDAVQLQLLWMGHLMRQTRPLTASWHIGGHEIQYQLDWNTRAFNRLAEQLHRLAQLQVRAVYQPTVAAPHLQPFQTTGHLWEVAVVEQADKLTIHVHAGLWMRLLLQQVGPNVRRTFTRFGQLALRLLQQDCCRDARLLLLIIYLHRQSAWVLYDLLATIDPDGLQAAIANPQDPSLWQWWQQAITTLDALGQPVIVGAADAWLSQSVQLAPQPVPQAPRSPLPSRTLRFDQLTGTDIRAARKAKGLTQLELSQALQVHQSLIAKIETGNRAVSTELEPALRSVLNL